MYDSISRWRAADHLWLTSERETERGRLDWTDQQVVYLVSGGQPLVTVGGQLPWSLLSAPLSYDDLLIRRPPRVTPQIVRPSAPLTPPPDNLIFHAAPGLPARTPGPRGGEKSRRVGDTISVGRTASTPRGNQQHWDASQSALARSVSHRSCITDVEDVADRSCDWSRLSYETPNL